MAEFGGVFKSLVKAQAEFPAIPRDRTVTVQTKAGGSYKFAYAPLDSIMALVRPVLTKNELALTQNFAVSTTGGPLLTTALIHADGSSISGQLPLPVHQGASAQELGGLITYCRRYAIVAILGLATEEDDDANHASGNTVQPRQAAPATSTPPPADTQGLQQSRGDTVLPGQVLVPFGKHKGSKVSDVPTSYWEWWLKQDGAKNPEVLAAVQEHLGLEVEADWGDPLDEQLPF